MAVDMSLLDRVDCERKGKERFVHLDMELKIDRPVEEVFDLWTDKERSPEWAAPVLEVRKLTDGPVGVGTQFLEIARIPGGRVEDIIEITAYEPGRVLDGTWSGGMEGYWESRFSEGGDGTMFHLHVDVTPSGLLGRLEPIIGGVVRRAMRKDIETFKRTVEAQAERGDA
jgi:uncharacterized membrane protein